LLDAQWRFTRLLPRLLDHVQDLGLRCSFGEAWRPPETAALYAAQGRGTKTSLHIDRLAIDLNLFSATGEYLTGTTAHEPLGRFWEALDPYCRWGGRFGDGNHYSLTRDGRRA
jgi:hypothetical protein